MTVGEKIRDLRHQRGLTQADVAERLNIDRTTYSKYETNHIEPSITILAKLTLIYNVDYNCLLMVN